MSLHCLPTLFLPAPLGLELGEVALGLLCAHMSVFTKHIHSCLPHLLGHFA